MFKPSSNFLTERSNAVLLLWILFIICVSCFSVILSDLFLAALWSSAGKGLSYLSGSIVCDVFLCFVICSNGVLNQVWYLIVSIPDVCLLAYCDSFAFCDFRAAIDGRQQESN